MKSDRGEKCQSRELNTCTDEMNSAPTKRDCSGAAGACRGLGSSRRFGVNTRKAGDGGGVRGLSPASTPSSSFGDASRRFLGCSGPLPRGAGTHRAAARLPNSFLCLPSQYLGWKAAGSVPLAFGPGAVFRTNTSFGELRLINPLPCLFSPLLLSHQPSLPSHASVLSPGFHYDN